MKKKDLSGSAAKMVKSKNVPVFGPDDVIWNVGNDNSWTSTTSTGSNIVFSPPTQKWRCTYGHTWTGYPGTVKYSEGEETTALLCMRCLITWAKLALGEVTEVKNE